MVAGLRVLLIEDNPADARLLQLILDEPPFTGPLELTHATRLADGLAQLRSAAAPDLVLLDLNLPDSSGLDTVRRAQEVSPPATIVLTGVGDEELATAAIHLGAQDYLVKGEFDAVQLKRAIRYAVERKALQDELQGFNRALEARVTERTEQLSQANAELAAEIEERKRIEIRLREAQRRAEQASEAKSRFLTTMSHELRTPLNSIMGFSSLLESEAFGALNPTQGRHVHNILASSRHLLALVSEVLDIARIESDKLLLERAELDPAELAREAIASAEGSNHGQNRRLALDLSGVVPALFGDRKRLLQVLLNLLSNALKFTAPGDEVTLRAYPGEGSVVFEVEDNGPGISQDDQARIFEPFFQGDSGPARQHDGAGLGLALAEHLVALHGGAITVQSAPDQGSLFRVTLPVAHLEER